MHSGDADLIAERGGPQLLLVWAGNLQGQAHLVSERRPRSAPGIGPLDMKECNVACGRCLWGDPSQLGLYWYAMAVESTHTAFSCFDRLNCPLGLGKLRAFLSLTLVHPSFCDALIKTSCYQVMPDQSSKLKVQ